MNSGCRLPRSRSRSQAEGGSVEMSLIQAYDEVEMSLLRFGDQNHSGRILLNSQVCGTKMSIRFSCQS